MVIPTFNEERYIGNILNDLSNQSKVPDEIILGDAFSTDRTREIAFKFGAKVVDGGKASVGRNNGAYASTGDIIVFFDADVRIKESFLEKVLDEFDQRKLDIAAGLFDVSTKSWFYKFVYSLWNLSKSIREKTNRPDADGQFMVFRRVAFESLHGFRTELIVGEDSDIVLRAVHFHKMKFGLLSARYIPSERRYQKIGFLRVALGSVLGGLSTGSRFKRLQKIAEKIYGMGEKY